MLLGGYPAAVVSLNLLVVVRQLLVTDNTITDGTLTLLLGKLLGNLGGLMGLRLVCLALVGNLTVKLLNLRLLLLDVLLQG